MELPVFKYDLYIWMFPKNNIVYKVSGLFFDDAQELALKWFESGDKHDYLLLSDKSSAEAFIGANTIDKSREWLVDLIESKGDPE